MRDLLDSPDPRRRDRPLNGAAGVAEASAPARPTSAAPVLRFDAVSKWYGPVIGINQVTLELRAGLTGLVGPNGAGKSTLLRLAAGHLQPDLGAVTVGGWPAGHPRAKRRVGYCPDADRFYEDMSGRQFVEALARLSGYTAAEARRRTDAALDAVGMTGRAERRLRGYSKGMRQRTKLAQALVHDPELLILDEPLSGVDPVGRQELGSLFTHLAEAGKCLLISSHELEELEKLTDQVAIMAAGRVAAIGTVGQIRDLLDDQPLAVLVHADRPRQLAKALLDGPGVEGVELGAEGALVVRARRPARFFRDLTALVLEEHFDVRRVEPLDDSAAAVLDYLLGGRPRA